jgi:hypothetical protein
MEVNGRPTGRFPRLSFSRPVGGPVWLVGFLGAALALVIPALGLARVTSPVELRATATRSPIPFTHVVVDRQNPPDPHVKAAGDIDGDRLPDLLAGSADDGGLYWYRYPRWTKHRVAGGSFTTDMQVADVNRDGDLDVIVPDRSGLRWYPNPRPARDPARGGWPSVLIGAAGAANHDVEIGDLNRDGKLDVVSRSNEDRGTYLWLQRSPRSWQQIIVSRRAGEGTALGDVDGDGDLDVVHNGFWVETPADVLAGKWIEHAVATDWPKLAGVHVVDLNRDGRKDIVLSPSESPGRLSWFESSIPRKGPWQEHVIDSSVAYVHTFKSGDVDLDGDRDLVTAEMHQSADPDEVAVYLNGGRGGTWRKQVIAVSGSHNIRVVDVDRDGDLDVFGANWDEDAPNRAVIEFWRNDLRSRRRKVTG